MDGIKDLEKGGETASNSESLATQNSDEQSGAAVPMTRSEGNPQPESVNEKGETTSNSEGLATQKSAEQWAGAAYKDAPQPSVQSTSSAERSPIPETPGQLLAARRYSVRSMLLLASTLVLAVTISVITVVFASTTFSTDAIYKSPFFPYNPEFAVFVLQLLAALSLVVLREAFIMYCEVLRWGLARKEISIMTLIVLSGSTGIWGMGELLISRKGGLFETWRMLAAYKLFVLYVAMLFGQFVWLLNISTRTAYKITGNYTTQYSPPVFSLDQYGYPFPFSRLDAWNFLDDPTRIWPTTPTVCSPENDTHCAAYVLPVNNFVNFNPDVPQPSGDPLYYLTPENPGYRLEFLSGPQYPVSLDDPQDPWAFCHNYTTFSNASVRYCMGGSKRSSKENDWIINAGWHFCLFNNNCTEIGDFPGYYGLTNVFITTMYIRQVNSMTVISAQDTSIVDIPSIQQPTPYPLNISQFFTAFSAPFMADILIAARDVRLYNSTGGLDLIYGFGNTSNTTIAADEYVESMLFAIYGTHGFVNPVYQLHGFLTYALTTNSIGANFQRYTYNFADQTWAIVLSPISMPIFTCVALFTIISCLVMLGHYGVSNSNSFYLPEIAFAAKLDAELQIKLGSLKDEKGQSFAKNLADIKVQFDDQSRSLQLKYR